MTGDQDEGAPLVPEAEVKRIVTFIVLQVLFLAISPFAGGFH